MANEKGGWVYILASKPNGILYVGITTNLIRRVFEHRDGTIAGFTKRYGIKQLVWFEHHADIAEAIKREKAIKNWPQRAWRVRLIVADNPDWEDLYDRIV